MINFGKLSFILCLLALVGCQSDDENHQKTYDVVVLGGGTGAVAAAIQSARSGANTLYVNPYKWHGGMLTSAGVSATDGNHQMPSGLWGEFRDSLRVYYGGPDSLFTGWVSNTMFEPSVGASFFEKMVAHEPLLNAKIESHWGDIHYSANAWNVQIFSENDTSIIQAKQLVDGTDLGDVAAKVGAQYNVGMDAKSISGEAMAPVVANDIIQDLTYAAILKDYGEGADMTIDEPMGYDPSVFYCACETNKCDSTKNQHNDLLDCDKMLTYGKLPNGKYMLNWPRHGNDYYVNMVDMNSTERAKVEQEAKLKTLQYIYFIQMELGYRNLGLAMDEFETEDGLAIYPYHREGRRINGLVRMNVNHILNPYASNLYKTGVAVGDYPIDHHHHENADAPEIDFPLVPSFSIPFGALIPKDVSNLTMADKAISVTNIVNGSSRLQPVILQIGQAAGLIAAMAAQKSVTPAELNIREVQDEILSYDGYIMPFVDVAPGDPDFVQLQKIGATGQIKGHGVPYKWANQTWFYPDSLVADDDGNILTKRALSLSMFGDSDPFYEVEIDVKGNEK